MTNWVTYENDHRAKRKKSELLIGCPAQHREWIIDRWIDYAFQAATEADMHPTFLVVMDPRDEPQHTMVRNQCAIKGVDLIVGEIEEVTRHDARDWDEFRYKRMVALRNMMLEGVRNFHPKYFLSLDSDILIRREAIKSMVEKIGPWAAIGSRCYMVPMGSTWEPSYAFQSPGSANLRREESPFGVFQVDIIMAIKLMTEDAYNIDYVYSIQGEDIGWSKEVYRNGFTLGWDGSHQGSKHVMERTWIDQVDPRVGY